MVRYCRRRFSPSFEDNVTWEQRYSNRHNRFTQNDTKNIKLENTRPWWNTWFLVQEIRLSSRQTSKENEQMLTRSTRRKQKCEEKQLNGRFKQLTTNSSHEKSWTWLRKGNLKTETEFLLIAEGKTKGKTTLIQKDPIKGITVNNYRPINCLPMMWKILTAQIREEIYYSLTSHWLFPE